MIIIIEKGTEDIAYHPIEGDTIVIYYMMYNLKDNNQIDKVITFAYSGSHDAYFALPEDDLSNIHTVEDANNFKVCLQYPADADNEVGMLSLFRTFDVETRQSFIKEWSHYHRHEYEYLYD